MKVENIKPGIGSVVATDRKSLLTDQGARQCLDLLADRAVLVFPGIGLSDEDQLALTDLMGDRVNFTRHVPGGDTVADDVYTITLDPAINTETEYVLGTYFWHMDGLTSDIPPPRVSLLGARRLAAKGGQTEFASTTAALQALPDDERAKLEGLSVVHSVVSAVRDVADPEDLHPMRRDMRHRHPLVWKNSAGRPSLLIVYSAESIPELPRAEGRALLARLLEWTAQPAFSLRHHWQEGDLVIWDNTAALHRVVPYAADSGRMMHRTTVAGTELAA